MFDQKRQFPKNLARCVGPKCVQKQNLIGMNIKDMPFGGSDNAHKDIWKEVSTVHIPLQTR